MENDMSNLAWSKQTREGSFEDNWELIKKYLERTSPEFSRSVKVIEHMVDGKIHTSVVYPLIIVPTDEQERFG